MSIQQPAATSQVKSTFWYKSGRLGVQIALICCINYAGVLISKFIPITIPGNILGMMLLLALLLTGVLNERYVRHACRFFLRYMALFFLPAGVAVMECAGLLKNAYLQFMGVCIITTILVFAVTVVTVTKTAGYLAQRRVEEA